MKLKNLISLALLSFPFISFAQYFTDSTVAVVALYSIGDTAHYSLDKAKLIKDKGVITSRTRIHYDIDLTVAEETEEYMLMHWTYRNAIVKDSGEADMTTPIFSFLSGLKVQYKTDTYGTTQGIVNWEEIQKILHHRLDSFAKASGSKIKADVLKNLRNVITGQNAINIIAGKEIETYHSLYGAEFSMVTPLKVATEVPNVIIPSKPFPGELEVVVNEINSDAGYSTLTYRSDIDQETGGAIITESVKVIMKGHMPKEIGFTSLIISDRLDFKYDLNSGWMTNVQWNRHTEVANKINLETFTLKLMEF